MINRKLLYFYKVFNQYRYDIMWNEVTDAEYLTNFAKCTNKDYLMKSKQSNLYNLLRFCEEKQLGVHFSHAKQIITIYKDVRTNKVIYKTAYEEDLERTCELALQFLESLKDEK